MENTKKNIEPVMSKEDIANMQSKMQSAGPGEFMTKEEVAAYLEKKKQRKTPERYAILDEIYSHKIHFDVETLYIQMKKRNYRWILYHKQLQIQMK